MAMSPSAGLINLKLPASSSPDFNGTGEILPRLGDPHAGASAPSPSTPPDTGLIADEHYDQLPTPYM